MHNLETMTFLQDIHVFMVHLDKSTLYLTIKYGFVDTQFGRILIGLTQNKDYGYIICLLYFVVKSDTETYDEARQRWPGAKLVPDDLLVYREASKIFKERTDQKEMKVVISVRGTPFEQDVWRALIAIDYGNTATYAEVAEKIGRPNAVRATASAVGKNEVSLLIPCHRVVSKNGATKYHWGAQLKQKILRFEAKSTESNNL